MNSNVKLCSPHLPSCCPKISTDGMPLAEIRDEMANMMPDAGVKKAILTVVEKWLDKPNAIEPIASIRDILDSIRILPRSNERLMRMNTFVRTLGQPEIFATFLDMVRDSSQRTGTLEQELSEISRKSTKHAVYGWCGQTRLVLSRTESTSGTLNSERGVQELLGKTPTAAWALSMHIWQPNFRAKGFPCGNQSQPNIISEPPHSHPFDFASMVVMGELHQSIYAQYDSDLAKFNKQTKLQKDRYEGIKLEHVQGVWPPHNIRELSEIVTLENRVLINAGDSYYMSSDIIHDVQVDANVASSNPAITLFLRSESYVKPHVYMASSMADYHAANPDLQNQGSALPESNWHEKLERVSAYIRGKNSTLNLSDVVNYEGEYAFFHV